MSQDTRRISAEVLTRIYLANDPMDDALTLSLYNPSLCQYRRDISISDVGAKLTRASRISYLQGGADAYIHHKNSTLWGNANYRNGKLKDIQGNVTMDPELLYPYFTSVEFPSGSADINMESYSLSGGYADHSGHWSRGVTLSYDAGLYYRDTDPRPKNVTGKLMLSLGAAYSLTDNYLLALAAGIGKYKQSCDIMFVGETGRTPIYHMTGPESYYNRFTGASESSNYSGKIYQASLGLFPKDRHGIIASANVGRFEFTKILTDLNKLPLCDAWHNHVSAMAGWVTPRVSAWGEFEAWRRHGTEHLFGDATSGVYPQVGALEMYADNHWSASLHAILDLQVSYCSVFVKAKAGYDHRCTIYLDPAYESLDNNFAYDIYLGARALLRSWTATATLGRTATNQQIASMSLARALGKYALGLRADWHKSRHNHCCDLSILLYF